MKNVVLIAPLPPPYGGISHWTEAILRHAQAHSEINIKLIDTSPRCKSIFELSTTQRLILGTSRSVVQIVTALKILPRGDILAVHVTSAGGLGMIRDLLMLLLARIFRHRSVLHLRFGKGSDWLSSYTVNPIIFRLALLVASHVISLDRFTTEAIQNRLPRVSVSTIPNCIDPSVFPVASGSKNKTVLFVGAVLPAKGIEDLLTAWADIGSSEWSLKIVGPCTKSYKSALLRRFPINQDTFIGELGNEGVLSEMAKAAILCLPSHTEGFPNVVVEAMALRCAVIASAVGAIPEILAKKAGIVVNPHDPTNLGLQLSHLMRDPLKREKIANKAHMRVREKYSIDRVYDEYKNIWSG